MTYIWILWFLFIIIMLCGCGKDLRNGVICLGDSQTYGKHLNYAQAYPAQLSVELQLPTINAGINSNTTRQMLARFASDVTRYQYRYVIIMAGTNDLYYGYDPSQSDDSYKLDSPTGLKRNILKLIDAALLAGMTPIVATPLPHDTLEEVPARNEAMQEYLAWLRDFIPRLGIPLIDFNAAFTNPEKPGYNIADLSIDGVHPSVLGSKLMAILAAKTIGSLEND